MTGGLNNPADLRTLEESIGPSASLRAVTATLFVSPNGTNTNGKSWTTAYTTIQAALDAASTDAEDCTLIMISPQTGATNYDINTTGDPTWTGNYILSGTHRNWAKIKNTHASATSIMKLTGRASLINLNFNLGTGTGNGVILTGGGFRVSHCQFVGESLTGAATALHIDGATTIKHGKVSDCDFLGHTTHMTGILIDNSARSIYERCHIHECAVGVQQVNAASDSNTFSMTDIGDCGIGFDIDAGNTLHICETNFHGNTTNIDDEVGDHVFCTLYGELPITIEPDDLTGVTVTAHNDANTWGSDTEIRAAATSTKPFRIVGVAMQPNVSQWYQLRFSSDSGSTFYDTLMVDSSKISGDAHPSGTETIFNQGTRISASIKAESGGEDTMNVWLKIQTI